MNWLGTKEIKVHVKTAINNLSFNISDKTRVLDFPSGSGYSLNLLNEMGAQVSGADLFPDLNRTDGVKVVAGELEEKWPFEDGSFDLVLCQEGIEHVGAQEKVFFQASRVLDESGTLLLTTPNYSNLKARCSYLFTESEAFGRIMPANEQDSLWLTDNSENKVYFGHIFLTGFTRLRLFAKLAGFEVRKVHSSRINYTSLYLFVLLYPLILFFSYKTYRRFLRKKGDRKVGKEVFKAMISPKLLLEGHLILEFKKVQSTEDSIKSLKSRFESDMIT